MGKQISTSSTAIGYYSKNWVESKIESTEDLIKVVKTKAYSNIAPQLVKTTFPKSLFRPSV